LNVTKMADSAEGGIGHFLFNIGQPGANGMVRVLLLTVFFGTTMIVEPAAARLFSPRVVSPHSADAYSLRTFSQFHRWRDLTGDARAWEIYCYLIDRQTGLFHMNEVLEGTDSLSEFRTVRDPIKIMNVYGYGYCGILGPVMAGISEGAGVGPARTLVLRDWNHVASEARYGGSWHYLDLDVRAAFRRADGTLASFESARSDASLWIDRGPKFFPNDPLESTRSIYQTTDFEYYHGFHSGGHTMDYVLRQGESFTRWWQPQGGRWHHRPEYNRSSWLCELLERDPRGPKPNHRHFTIHNHGNGCFVYQPNLSAGSSDFVDGVYHSHNVVTSRDGLTLANAGTGFAIFEVHSPYVIVPLVGDREVISDDCEASVVSVDATGVTLEISMDHGKSWQSVLSQRDGAHSQQRYVVDLTSQVSGKYGYLLRITLHGRPGDAVVRGLAITTWVQVAPAALPLLRPGINRMSIRCGDHYGLDTRVVGIEPDASQPEELMKYLVVAPGDYDPARSTSRIRGNMVAQVDAPPGTSIAWISMGAAFQTHQREQAIKTRNQIAYAVDHPENFQTVYVAAVPPYTQHWHYHADREVRLDQPVRVAFVRFTGDPAVNNIRIFAHCLESCDRTTNRVEVTHGWREKGQCRQARFPVTVPGEYEMTVTEDRQEEWIRLAVPSVCVDDTP
jgi:hypothetical protein